MEFIDKVDDIRAQTAQPVGSEVNIGGSIIDTDPNMDVIQARLHAPRENIKNQFQQPSTQQSTQSHQKEHINIIEISPCDSLPIYIANTHFYAKIGRFEDVKAAIRSILSNNKDVAFSYFKDEQCFKCKLLHRSNVREINVNVYWSSEKKDHVIEVRRVYGDGVFLGADIFSELLNGICREPVREVSSGKLRRLDFQVPDELLLELQITLEQFLDGIKPIVAMANDQYYETRVEAAKMFCELPGRDEQFLQHEQVVALIVPALQKLLRDPFDDIQEFAVVAVELFSSMQEYALRFLADGSVVSALVATVKALKEEEFYLHAHMMRKAMNTLQTLGQTNGVLLRQRLSESSRPTAEKWMAAAERLTDPVAKTTALGISTFYTSA
jgi:hypothetical protein